MDRGPRSPDGKYWWDGQKWNPVQQPDQPQPPRRPQRRSRWLTLPWVLVGLVLCFPIGLVLTWLMPWSRRTKLIITGITSGLLVIGLVGVSASPQPTTTTQSAMVAATTDATASATSTPPPSPTPTSTPTPTPTAAPAAQAPQPTSHADYLAELRARGVSAICNDGTLSYSRTRSGTCSHHNGVREWTGLI